MSANFTAAWHSYLGERPSVRLHVALRAITCPFDAFLDHFPREGSVLDVGCGHGLLINLLARQPYGRNLRLHGIDHDSAKIEVARRCAPPGALFSAQTAEKLAKNSFDAITMVDVLYAINRRLWPEIIGHCFRALKPGGLLILKEVVDRPRWKYWAIMAQESLSVRILRITKGEPPHFESPLFYRQALAQAGFMVEKDQPLPAASWVSHYLFLARKAG